MTKVRGTQVIGINKGKVEDLGVFDKKPTWLMNNVFPKLFPNMEILSRTVRTHEQNILLVEDFDKRDDVLVVELSLKLQEPETLLISTEPIMEAELLLANKYGQSKASETAIQQEETLTGTKRYFRNQVVADLNEINITKEITDLKNFALSAFLGDSDDLVIDEGIKTKKVASQEEPKVEVKEEVKEEPKVEVKEEVKEEPKVEVKEEVKEEPKVEVKEEIKEEPKVEVKEEVNEEPKVEPKEEIKEEPKVEVKEEVKEEPKVEPKEEVKEEPKVEVKEKVKAEPKVEVKEEVKEEPKVEVKEEPKVEEKVEPKEEPKVEEKVEVKEEPKEEPSVNDDLDWLSSIDLG